MNGHGKCLPKAMEITILNGKSYYFYGHFQQLCYYVKLPDGIKDSPRDSSFRRSFFDDSPWDLIVFACIVNDIQHPDGNIHPISSNTIVEYIGWQFHRFPDLPYWDSPSSDGPTSPVTKPRWIHLWKPWPVLQGTTVQTTSTSVPLLWKMPWGMEGGHLVALKFQV